MRQFNLNEYIKLYLGYYYAELQYMFLPLLWPLSELWVTYEAWARDMNYKANLSSQTISIEGNLNKLFDPDQQRISITDGNFDSMLYLPLDNTEGNEVFFPLDENEGAEIGIPINEFERVGEYDFIVNIPAAIVVKEAEIIGAVRAQKLAGKTFNVNQV